MISCKGTAVPILLITIVVLTFSCATKGVIVDIKQAPPTDQCIVFGKLTLMEHGVVKKWGSVFYRKPFLMLLPQNSDVASSYDIKDDGKFFWALAPGEYTILGFSNRANPNSQLPVKAKFTVPADKKCMYIGNFQLVIRGNHFLYGIEDNSQIAISDFKDRYPHIVEIPIVDIMKKEIHIGSCASIEPICRPKWGINCELKHLGKFFYGVIPINPEATTKKFKKKTNSLTPSFEWQPSPQKKLTYDLIIYEAAAYYYDGSKKLYIQGRFVLLEEDIKKPNYQMATKLKPGTNYYWSVRLRDASQVSTWSSYSFFYFYVIGAAFGANQWFTFSTPTHN